MTIAAWVTAISAVIGGIVYLAKFYAHMSAPIPDKVDQTIDAKEADNKLKAEDSGRPV